MEAIPPSEIRSLKAPSQGDWERHRPLIKRLYVDQGQKLDNIMATMLQFGHKASLRTYKNWIKRWGFEKKNKERDMVAILRKKTQREAAGKRSLFRVRGQPVTMEQVEYYFKRKKGAIETQVADAPTPSDVSCWSPSSSPSPSRLNYDAAPFSENERFGTAQRITQPPLASDTNDFSLGLTQMTPFTHIQINKTILEENDIINILSENPMVSYPPSTPQTYHIPERLFASIKNFYEMSIQTGAWIMCADGHYRAPSQLRLSYEVFIYHFYDYSNIAVAQIKKGAFVEARRALSKMFNQVNKIVQEGLPQTINIILLVFINFRREGYHDICLSLRKFVGRMATIKAKDHSLGEICQFFSMLDEDSLDQTLIQSLKCVTDSFIASAGPFNPDSIDYQLTYIENTYRVDPLEAEICLEKLLKDCQANSRANSRVVLQIMLEFATVLLNRKRYDQAGALAQSIITQNQQLNFSSAKELQAVVCLALALAQYYMKRRDVAEANIRVALQMAKEFRGSSHIITIGIRDILESWLREWGREDEADGLQAEVGVFDVVIEPDEIDLEISQGEI